MTTGNSAIADRLPVWMALSELFLDTELDAADHDRLATVLAATRYSTDELEDILRFEVTPVLKPNLRSVAGAWAGFDSAWLREQISPRLGRRPPVRWPVFWMVRKPWRSIRARVVELRGH